MPRGTIGRAQRILLPCRKTKYAYIYQPKHPRAQSHGYVLEHVLIAEAALGYALPVGAQVHHADENTLNNNNNNLVICENNRYHKLLHVRLRAYKACGNANARVCEVCGTHDNQADISISGRRAYHRKCNAAKATQRRLMMQAIYSN